MQGLLAGGLVMISASVVLAHARLIRSRPANDARLESPPTTVDLWFNELLDAEFNSIEVFPVAELSSPHHTTLARDAPTVDPADRTHLAVALPLLAPDDYVVEYRVLSRDGHSAAGRLTFHVGTAR